MTGVVFIVHHLSAIWGYCTVATHMVSATDGIYITVTNLMQHVVKFLKYVIQCPPLAYKALLLVFEIWFQWRHTSFFRGLGGFRGLG